MPKSPQRPFIPHLTPNKPRAMSGSSEFRLAKPFVPGAERLEAPFSPAPADAFPRAEPQLPGIDEFLQHEAPSAPSAQVYGEDAFATDFEDSDELPPVEHFLDPLPPVSEFSSDEFSTKAATGNAIGHSESTDLKAGDAELDWLETEWQNYDWRAAAALGETVQSEASSAWAETDWSSSAPRPIPARPSAAHAIATALDQIAQRIREGELVLPGAAATPDPATIAATLAALLGIRK